METFQIISVIAFFALATASLFFVIGLVRGISASNKAFANKDKHFPCHTNTEPQISLSDANEIAGKEAALYESRIVGLNISLKMKDERITELEKEAKEKEEKIVALQKSRGILRTENAVLSNKVTELLLELGIARKVEKPNDNPSKNATPGK